MKRILGITALFLLTAAAHGQGTTTCQGNNCPYVTVVNADPTGNICTNSPQLTSYNGTVYGCKNGTMAATGSTGVSQVVQGTNVTISEGSPCTGSCTINASGGGSGTVSGQANGVIPLATASTTIGAQSALSDNGTTVTSTEPVAAPSVVAGTPTAAAKAALPAGAHGLACDESATAGVPAALVDYVRCDSTTHALLLSNNGAPEQTLVPGNAIQISGSPFTMLAISGFYWNNTSGAYVFDLATPVAGLQQCFGNYKAQTHAVSMVPGSGVTIYYKGVAGTTSSSTGLVSGGAAGDFICLIGTDSTTYIAIGAGVGTWINN